MATQYTVTEKATIRKTASSSGAAVTSADKGTKVYISSTSGGWAKLSNDHTKINNKAVAGCYIAVSKIKKMATGTAESSSGHAKHENKKMKGEIIINAFISNSCDSNPGKLYFPKGTSVTITAQCMKKKMYYVTGAKKSNGKTGNGWIAQTSVKLNALSAAKEQKLLTKAANAIKSAKNKILANSDSIDLTRKTIQQIADIKIDAINSSDYANKLLVKNAQGIYGMPYQFMPSVDMRLSDKTSFGRKYVERIVSRMPLVLFTPGRPKFAANFSKQDKNNIYQTLLNSASGISKGKINDILKGSGRYYTMEFAYNDYYKYVNQMMRFGAIVLGIGNVQHGTQSLTKTINSNNWGTSGSKGTKLKSYKWQNATNKELKGFVNSKEYIAFYVDSDTSISESLSNGTTNSSIAEAIRGASSLSREVQFIAGSMAGRKLNALDSETFQNAYDRVKEIANEHLNGSTLFTRLGEMFTTVSKGGQIAFPEIWEDSTFSKTYNLSLKLRTPDADVISWYLNIYAPLIHILALAAPHEMGPNGYSAPFLVRATYKGIFNCDMGIITDVDISKGREGAWTIDGLPTEVDINITIKDLYNFFTISNKQGAKFFDNTAMIDYLCNTCGVNINKMEVPRLVEAYTAFSLNKYKDMFPYAYLGLQQGASNLAGSLYKKIVEKDYV